MNLLKDDKDLTKAYACVCLTNMASDEIVREEVSQFSFGHSILPALSSALVLVLLKFQVDRLCLF